MCLAHLLFSRENENKRLFFNNFISGYFRFYPNFSKNHLFCGKQWDNNGLLRHLFVIPILFLIIKLKGLPYKITLHQLKNICLVGIVGNALTVATLYTSYIVIFKSAVRLYYIFFIQCLFH